VERASREVWVGRVAQWRESGATATEFARELGVSVSSLRWWSWKLGSTRRRGKRAKTTSVSPLTFVEMTSAVRREPIEIVLASGTRVLVQVDVEQPVLERLFNAIERRR
jgi:transposase-like protein